MRRGEERQGRLPGPPRRPARGGAARPAVGAGGCSLCVLRPPVEVVCQESSGALEGSLGT